MVEEGIGKGLIRGVRLFKVCYRHVALPRTEEH